MKSCKGCVYQSGNNCNEGNYYTTYNDEYRGEIEVIMNKYGSFQTLKEMREDENKCGKEAKLYETFWQSIIKLFKGEI